MPEREHEEILLSVSSLSAGYRAREVLGDVTISLKRGETAALIGPNGAGKSTLLKTIIKMIPALRGTVYLSGKPLEEISQPDLAKQMSILLTGKVEPELMTCYDVVAAGRYPHTGRFGILSEKDREAILDAMTLAEVKELAGRDFSRISDGQRQRVMLARAICQEPELLVLDEPTSYLDIRYKLEFLRILKTLSSKRNIAVLMSLHELELAKMCADRLLCVKDGRIDRSGTPEEIFSGNYIEELFETDPLLFREVYGSLETTYQESEPALHDAHCICSGNKKFGQAAKPARFGAQCICSGNEKSGQAAKSARFDAHCICSGNEKSGQESEPARFEHYIRSGTRNLRLGYTTGSCAAMAAFGAAAYLLGGEKTPVISFVTPAGLTVCAEPSFYEKCGENEASCGIRKDAGDDPDVTDGVTVIATAERIPGADGEVEIDGGEGVGRVTRPGLDQEVGAAAINRIPREMIRSEVLRAAAAYGYRGALKIRISIPGGRELAAKTFNPELGIEGGLSVLGTTGIVEPMSEEALIGTIELSMKQARAEGHDRLILTPGKYGETFLRESRIFTDGIPCVKCSNYIGEALDLAVVLGFRKVYLIGHAGKLVKLAGGVMNTHSRVADCRREIFAAHAAMCGLPPERVKALMEAATSDACLQLLREDGRMEEVMKSIVEAARQKVEQRVRGACLVGILMFSNTYGELGRSGIAIAQDSSAKPTM